MTAKHIAAALAMVLALVACGTDTYESVSKEINELAAKEIPMTVEDQAQFALLREQGEEFQRAGKTEESIKALKQALQIIEMAQDAELLGKSDG